MEEGSIEEAWSIGNPRYTDHLQGVAKTNAHCL